MNIVKPFQTFADLDGSPLDAGFLFIGQPNLNPETNPVPVYWDEALTIPAAQPVRTSNGFIVRAGSIASIYSSGDYSMTVKNKNSVLVFYSASARSLNPLLSNNIGLVVDSIAALKALPKNGNGRVFVTGYYAKGDGGGGQYYYDPSDTTSADNLGTVIVATDGGRWKLIVDKFVSVAQFGAYRDGTNPAITTTAIQNCINWCQSNLKALYWHGTDPSQFYSVNATLTVSQPIEMISDGSYNVLILATGLAIGQYLLDVDGTAFGTFENAKIGGFTLRAGAGDCMRIKNASRSDFVDIGISNCRNGIVYTGTRCFSNNFKKVQKVGTVTGTNFLMEAHTGGGQHCFDDSCSFGGSTGFAITSTTDTDSIYLNCANFEQCTVNSLVVEGGVAGLTIIGGRTEGCDSTDFLIRPAAGKTVSSIVIKGVNFSASDSGGLDRIILGGGAGKVRGYDISENTVSHGGHNFSANLVQLNGDGESGTISNNYLDGLLANCAPVNVRRSNVAIYNNEANNGKFANSLTFAEENFAFTDASGAGLTLGGSGNITRHGRMVFWEALVTFPVTADISNVTLAGLTYTDADDGGKKRAGGYVSATDSVATGVMRIGANILLTKSGMAFATNADMSGKTIYLAGKFATTTA